MSHLPSTSIGSDVDAEYTHDPYYGYDDQQAQASSFPSAATTQSHAGTRPRRRKKPDLTPEQLESRRERNRVAQAKKRSRGNVWLRFCEELCAGIEEGGPNASVNVSLPSNLWSGDKAMAYSVGDLILSKVTRSSQLSEQQPSGDYQEYPSQTFGYSTEPSFPSQYYPPNDPMPQQDPWNQYPGF